MSILNSTHSNKIRTKLVRFLGSFPEKNSSTPSDLTTGPAISGLDGVDLIGLLIQVYLLKFYVILRSSYCKNDFNPLHQSEIIPNECRPKIHFIRNWTMIFFDLEKVNFCSYL